MPQEMMLFLRKLAHINVQAMGVGMSISREGAAPNVVVRVERTGKQPELKRFKVHKRRYEVPPAVSRQEPKREAFKSTEVVLAFPLKTDGMPLLSAGLGRGRKSNSLFAFLPVRSYGFKFVIQVIPASIPSSPRLHPCTYPRTCMHVCACCMYLIHHVALTQADFLLAASREDIMKDNSPWNQMILNLLPGVRSSQAPLHTRLDRTVSARSYLSNASKSCS